MCFHCFLFALRDSEEKRTNVDVANIANVVNVDVANVTWQPLILERIQRVHGPFKL